MSKNTIYGLHAVTALIENHPDEILSLTLQNTRTDARLQAIVDAAKQHHLPLQLVDKRQLDKITRHAPHQGVVATIKRAQTLNEGDLDDLLQQNDHAFFLILDNIQDPHNLGACLRSAEAAGVTAVIAPKDKSASITPTVRTVASGAAEVVPFIEVTNLARTMQHLKSQGVWLIGAAGEAEQSYYSVDYKGNVGIVVGAEGTGLRDLTRKHCDFLVKIPMQGSVSSLNVSVATGIFLFEALRQRIT